MITPHGRGHSYVFSTTAGEKPFGGFSMAKAKLGQTIAALRKRPNRVFPVLMADEVDAAMDVDRAGFTAECLRGLLGKIKQIMLVSHRRLEADSYIEQDPWKSRAR